MKKIFILFNLIFKIIDKKFKIFFIFNVLFNLCANVVQILGLTSAIPFLTILINPEIVETNKYLSLIYNTLEFTSIHNFIIFFGAIFLTLVIIGNFLIAISTFMQVYVSQSITKNIQYKLTNFYLRQDYNELINQTSSQKRANITVSDSLDNRFFFPLTEIIPKLTIVIILSGISLYLFPKLTVSVLVVITLILGTINFNIKKKLDETGTQIAKANYKLNKLMFESFQIIKIVIINQAVNFFMKDLKLIHKNLIKYNSFSHAISQIPKIVLETILVCFIIITSILMYRFESDYLITTLSFFGIFGYKIFPNISHSYSYFTIIRSGINSFEYLKKDLILYFKSSQKKTYILNEKFDKIESIKINIKKSFYFDKDKNKILEPQVINFYPNKLNIISGESGGGKSTLINLLMGFILDQNIEIIINGLQIDKKIYPGLQSIMGYVPQKFELIDESIENNIKLGKDYSKEEYEKTINICGLNEFVSKFSHRENINIGENNEGISGGQAQRISIARAIIKKPKILILDEGTGQLDKETEFRIINSLIKQNYTIILVTHRYENLLNIGNLKYFYMKNGKLTETNE